MWTFSISPSLINPTSFNPPVGRISNGHAAKLSKTGERSKFFLGSHASLQHFRHPKKLHKLELQGGFHRAEKAYSKEFSSSWE
ncbi:hypothetical protein Gasu2_16760 [Galdieria sulphuraria]|nr:hypothetical protein Gasu2_16760 [Galdieria sulphuraria]